jgi:hypothetical protein
MIVVTGTAAIVLIVLGVIIWIAETANKARRLAAQRAKNRELRSQSPVRPQASAPSARPGGSAGAAEPGKQPPSMPYGM